MSAAGSAGRPQLAENWEQRLEEFCQANNRASPEYVTRRRELPGQRETWSCAVHIGSQTVGASAWYELAAFNKRAAMEEAAKKALEHLSPRLHRSSLMLNVKQLLSIKAILRQRGHRHEINEVDQLVLFAKTGDINGVRALIHAGCNVNAPIEAEGSVLAIAVRRRDTLLVQILLSAGADVNLQLTSGMDGSALAAAIRCRNLLFTRILLQMGADANLPLTHGMYGSALATAVRYKDMPILRLLLDEGSDVNYQIIQGNDGSALAAAIRYRDKEIIQMLLDNGADVSLPLLTGQFRDAIELTVWIDDNDILQMLLHTENKSNDNCTMIYRFDFPLSMYEKRRVDGLDILGLPTLTKTKSCVLFSTCENYLFMRYGSLGVQLLKSIMEALRYPISGSVKLFAPIAAWSGVSEDSAERRIMITATLDHLEITFPKHLMGLSEAVAWFCLAFRSNPRVIPQISSGRYVGNRFLLVRLQPLSSLSGLVSSCWSKLFGSAVIAKEQAVDDSSEWSLAMSFADMLKLSAVEYPVSTGTGTVFMGYSTALIPIERRDEETIEWHLEVAEDDRQFKVSALQATQGEWMQTQDINELISKKVLLGWCPEAKVVLGTGDATNDIDWSDAASKHISWHWTGANLQLLAQSAAPAQLGGQVGFSFTRSSNTIQFSASSNYSKCLRNSIKEQIIVYDTVQRRAWLIPLITVFHQMLLAYSKDIPINQQKFSIPHADPTSSNTDGLASFDALKDSASLIVEGHGGDELTIRELIMGFSANLSKASLHKSYGRRIHGYEFMDVVRDSPRSKLKQKNIERQGLAWASLLEEVNCLFCSNFGDAIRGNRALCLDSPCNRLPMGKDLMAASTSSINVLWRRYPSLRRALGPSAQQPLDAQCWILTATTFQQCSHPPGEVSCWEGPSFLQDIRAQDRESKDSTVKTDEFPNGAVVFGCNDTKTIYLNLVRKWT
ncbi:hypothetical protein BJX64DRAFT_295160 [Aspergillus heterothallicus]